MPTLGPNIARMAIGCTGLWDALGMSAVSPTGGLGTVWEPKEESNGFQAHPSHASSTAVESGVAVFALSGFECASVV